MKRREFVRNIGGISGVLMSPPLLFSEMQAEPIACGKADRPLQGIWSYTIGEPEKITPLSTRTVDPKYEEIQQLPSVLNCPVIPEGIANERGVLIKIPLKKDEYVYGLGLQLQSFQQNGLKKMLRVNADPKLDTGDSHAPVPFYITTSGYGVLVDTARYVTFYMGNKKHISSPKTTDQIEHGDNTATGTSLQPGEENGNVILIEIPRTEGARVYVFGGPSMLNAVQRYNLFSGGGALPPRWGLGFWYRVHSDFSREEVEKMADYFRKSSIPCDVLGLEPHWQSHAYSCSYVWSNLFPDPAQMLKDLEEQHFRVNLWEHAFVHPASPIYQDLIPFSGDYEVWGGLVPDFLTEAGKRIFADFHKKEHVDMGVSGYKADECDNSDFTGNWSFPEPSRFPSGADGEQMHAVFGLRYQDTLLNVFRKKGKRTYGLVRSSGALAAPYPFVLYSDLYDHKTFIHGIAQSGFSGLLWTPEVRHASNKEDLIRRLQTVVFSPLAMVNAWYLKNPPWKQIEREANNEGKFDENWKELEDQCRTIINWRMKLIPYIHTAFVRYYRQGIPPFRSLVLDYPDDPEAYKISDQFMMGEDMLIAPVVSGESSRKFYLPEGNWFDLWTSEKYAGKKEYTQDVPLDRIPVFVKEGTILPLAKTTLHTDDPDSWELTVMIFGEDVKPAVLFEEDGSWAPVLNEVKLFWDNKSQEGHLERQMNLSGQHYSVTEWKRIRD